MPFKNPRVVATSPDPAYWPAEDCPEFLFAGKSNVGKSSLINALCGTKKLAYVGQTPGKTRMLNFYEVNEGIRLVDAPGYGYQKTDPKRNIDFGTLMERYFDLRSDLCRGILLLMDCRRDVSEDDFLMKQLADEYEIPLLVILTKTDKLNTTEKNRRPKQVADVLGITPSNVLITSSQKKDGVEQVLKRILALK
ncbi:MAG: YihA family ribosome biogenesis GTP-binding protein [Erysipelotrichales bacterium]|nr:YihA family ribosome biogenesis GTP-binding protein [Erysipelotrichales bacterium]